MPKSNKDRKTLALIDGSSYIYRAFYAIRGLANSKGFPTGAVYGFINMLKKVINDKKPDYIAVAFDAKGPNFRHEIYPEYKANRPEMPEDLRPQIPKIKELVDAYNVKSFEVSGFEADDIIGTVVSKLSDDVDIVIITGDKDMSQLVSDHTTLLDTMKDKVVDIESVKENYGTSGDGIVELFGLSGDTTDNIPGIPGIGEKTAVELIKKYGTIENLIENVDDFSGKKRENIKKHGELALLSRRLFRIDRDVPIEVSLEEMDIKEPEAEKLKKLFLELEFTSLLSEIEGPGKGIDVPFETVLDEKRLKEIIEEAEKTEWLSVDTETTSKNPMEADLVGISLCFDKKSSYYIPLAHRYIGAPKQLDMKEALNLLSPILSDPKVKKVGQNIKYDYIVLKKYGIEISPISFDTMVASYVINPSRKAHNLDAISMGYLGHRTITYKDVAGSGKGQLTFDMVDIDTASRYSAEDSFVVFNLMPILKEKLIELSTDKLFYDVEVPLIKILADMEICGVRVDEKLLAVLSAEFRSKISELEKKITDLAGEIFNINSTQQLAKVLFEKMRIPVIKKTKTGYSTDNDVLTTLSGEYPIAADVLEYRSLAKLKSTYVDSLPKLINKKTGRIHTSYNQTVTATGRLSSSDPNLQNIPIRTSEGRRIREAFIPDEGHIFISSDYSQIELRLLAHFSKDPALIEAFARGEDIHQSTASLIFGVGPNDVTPEMRRKAKTINFGIIYGISAHGLSQQLGIPHAEAQKFIDSYFEKFSGVRKYFDDVMKRAEADGFVTTIMDRRRYLPELKSTDRNIKSFAQRMAINTPVQGSAADIIKIAMINLNRRLVAEGLKARMILQVHDELVIEAPQDEVEKVRQATIEEMEGVKGVMALSVPIDVDVNTGKNWSEVH